MQFNHPYMARWSASTSLDIDQWQNNPKEFRLTIGVRTKSPTPCKWFVAVLILNFELKLFEFQQDFTEIISHLSNGRYVPGRWGNGLIPTEAIIRINDGKGTWRHLTRLGH